MFAGLELAIAHIINCLHAKDVLNRDEVASGLRLMARAVSPLAAPTIEQIAVTIETAPDPDGPRGPNAPLPRPPKLVVIPGGKQ